MTLGFILIVVGIFLYIFNVVLIRSFLKKGVPEILDDKSKDYHGNYLWEHTAGTGVVPKWVSLIGLFAIPIFILGLILIIISFFK